MVLQQILNMHSIMCGRNVKKPFKQRTSYLFILWWTVILGLLLSSAGGSDISCQHLKSSFSSKGLPAEEVPPQPVNGKTLRICAKEAKSCCTPELETFLGGLSRREFNLAYKAAINKLLNVLKMKAHKFDEVFKKLLAESKRDFDEMFKRTYGIIYEQNAYVFTDLFHELESYFSKGQVDLEDTMDNFFNTLYQKMFTVLNSQYQFDSKYLTCVGEHMQELKPFDDVPQKLSVQIKRSFVATRTFAQGLNVASDVVANMLRLGPAGDCREALLRMSHCSSCRGLTDIKPCNNFCINVMKGCLAYHSELDTEWNNFIHAMDKVVDRLLGPFNIEMVVDPIDIKISEAIMNFQENGPEVSQRVFSGCGKPMLGRKRRQTRKLEVSPINFSKQEKQQTPSLEKLIREIRTKLKDTKTFWVKLPYQICNEDNVSATTAEDSCWNGTDIAKYNRKIWGDGFGNQHSNPEVSIDTARPSSLLNEQIYTLKTMISKLKNSYNGLDVNWIDNESSTGMEGGSGEGSGDKDDVEGSGYEDPEDDDEDGRHPYPDVPHVVHPVSTNEESNIIPKTNHDVVHGSTDTNHIYTSNGAESQYAQQLNLIKAVTTYIFPICLVWVGGIVSDWL